MLEERDGKGAWDSLDWLDRILDWLTQRSFDLELAHLVVHPNMPRFSGYARWNATNQELWNLVEENRQKA